MFHACITAHLLTDPTELKGGVGAQAVIEVDLARPSAMAPEPLHLRLLCEPLLMRRLMRFSCGDVITVDGQVFMRRANDQGKMTPELLLNATRILSIEARELFALNWNNPSMLRVYRARKKL